MIVLLSLFTSFYLSLYTLHVLTPHSPSHRVFAIHRLKAGYLLLSAIVTSSMIVVMLFMLFTKVEPIISSSTLSCNYLQPPVLWQIPSTIRCWYFIL